MKSFPLFLGGLALVILPSFVLASHTDNYQTEMQMGITISSDADCSGIPGSKFRSGHTTSCWLPVAKDQTIGGALGIINRITNWLVAILVLFGIFYGTMGAFEFLSSGGDDKRLTSGKKKIYYAVGGVALGLLVKGIITLLVNFVGNLGA